jgi:hypothetical protein
MGEQIDTELAEKAKKIKDDEPGDEDDGDSGFVTENSDEPEYLEQMRAILGLTEEEQIERLRSTLFDGTENVLQIATDEQRAEMMLSMILLSETHVNRDAEDEPALLFFK